MSSLISRRPFGMCCNIPCPRDGGAQAARYLGGIDARSDALLGLVTGVTGMVQPFPATAAACTALGWPSPTALWANIPAAGNWTDAIGALTLADLNAPLRNRSVNGVASGSNLWSVLAAEVGSLTNQALVAANAAALDIALQDFTISFVVRTQPLWPGAIGYPTFISKNKIAANFNGYAVLGGAAATTLTLQTNDGVATVNNNFANCIAWDGATHLISVKAQRGVSATAQFDGAAPVVSASSPSAGSLTNAQKFTVLNYSEAGNLRAPYAEIMWLYICIGTASLDGHTALWRHLLASGLAGTPNSYVRASTMSLPISATQTATAGSGQVGIGYHANAVDAAGGNSLGTGLVFENQTSFLAIGSNNLPGFSVIGGNAITVVDGVNAMRSGIRVTQSGAWNPFVSGYAYTPSPFATVGAPSNTDYAYGGWVKRGTVGTSGIMTLSLQIGGVSEFVTLYSSASVPATWTYVSGTVASANAGNTRGLLVCGALNNADNCEFADWFVVKGTTVVPIAYIYTGTGAAVTMNCPTETINNAVEAVYSPTRGSFKMLVANFQGTAGSTLMSCGAAAAAGALVLDYNAGQLRLRAWNATPALVDTVNCGALDTAGHELYVKWNSGGMLQVYDTPIATGVKTLIGSSTPASWTAGAAPATLYIGTDSAGANAARATISRVRFFNK